MVFITLHFLPLLVMFLSKQTSREVSLRRRKKRDKSWPLEGWSFSSVCETRASSDFSSQMNFMEFLCRTWDRTSFPVSSNEQTHLHTWLLQTLSFSTKTSLSPFLSVPLVSSLPSHPSTFINHWMVNLDRLLTDLILQIISFRNSLKRITQEWIVSKSFRRKI